MIYLYVGSDSAYLKLKIRQEFIRTKSALEQVEFLDFSAFEDLVQDVIAEAGSPSFAAEKKIIIYDKCFFLSTNREKVSTASEHNLGVLKEYIHNPDPINDLYLLVTGALAKGEITDLLKKKGKYQSFDKPSEDELKMIASQYLELRKVKIDQSALNELIKRIKQDYSLLMHELAKLENYSDHLTLSDIGVLVNKPCEDNIFALATHLIKGEISAALGLLRDLNRSGIDNFYLLAILAGQFRFMCEVSFLVSRKFTEPQIVKELKANAYRVKLTRAAIKNVSARTFHQILSDLFDLDRHAKLDLDDLTSNLEFFILGFRKYLKSESRL